MARSRSCGSGPGRCRRVRPGAQERLAAARTYWVATVNPDGRPHVMPVLGLWLEGAVYFSASERSRKGRNLARDSCCVLTVESRAFPAIDLVIEGDAARVTEDSMLHRVAGAYASKYGWQLTVRGGAVYGDGAPTAVPPPYAVFEVTPTAVFGFPGVNGTDGGSFSPTRWHFSRAVRGR